MAVRLNVIMVHSPPATAAAQRMSESIVGELIGRPGIDLTLVGPLDQIREGTTDQLSLESITSDVAVLDWRVTTELEGVLASIGINGIRWPHRHDQTTKPMQPSEPARKIFAYDLNEFADAKTLCSALSDLLANRQVATFSLGSPTSLGDSTPSPSNTVASGQSPSASPSPKPPLPKPPAQPAPSAKQPAAPDAAEGAKYRPDNQPSGTIDLEKLVGQLDEFDP